MGNYVDLYAKLLNGDIESMTLRGNRYLDCVIYNLTGGSKLGDKNPSSTVYTIEDPYSGRFTTHTTHKYSSVVHVVTDNKNIVDICPFDPYNVLTTNSQDFIYRRALARSFGLRFFEIFEQSTNATQYGHVIESYGFEIYPDSFATLSTE